MDTATFRDIVQVVPAIAMAAAGQVAATALGQCARLLDQHGPTATVLTRHAARNAAYHTGDLSQQVATNAHIYASRAAYQAQRHACQVTNLTETLASVVEATVQTATATAQQAAHRQADRVAAFADDQAIAVNHAVQSLIGRLPGSVPQNSRRGSGGSAATASEFDPWADIPPRHSGISSDSNSAQAPSAARPAADPVTTVTTSAPAPARAPCHQQQVQQRDAAVVATSSVAVAPTPVYTQMQQELDATQEALAHTMEALDDAYTQLAVKQLTADIFKSVERQAVNDELQQLSTALLQSHSELQAARQQLQDATSTVAALPQQMVLMVQNQMRRAMREGMVELMRDALASPEPIMPAAPHAVAEMQYTYGYGHSAVPYAAAEVDLEPSPATCGARGVADNVESYSAVAEAQAAVVDDQARTAADQATALFHLDQELGLDAVAPAGDVIAAAAAVAAHATAVDGDDRLSDEDAFVLVESASAGSM